MNAQLKTVAPPIKRPIYGHRELLGFDRETWIEVNRDALRSWWALTGDAAGLINDAIVGEADFAYFAICQYDVECSQKERFKDEYRSHRDRSIP